jgi:polyisoprenoid-binding protein YceI
MKTISRLITTLALSAAVVAPAFAAPVSYGVEANHTFPRFSYTHLGFTTQQSRFDKTTGTVVYDKEGRDQLGEHGFYAIQPAYSG